MKQIIETTFVEKAGHAAVEQEFKIRNNAASFSILSSGLYSNKILAIVRELSCNAYDSHKAAGNPDTPFELTLPTVMNPFFIVNDFGTGLSHDAVLNTYTTYFESTKTDSDDFIGQLGLGSKSPFSYTTQFSVESRQDGVLNAYSMYINDRGVPAVAHLGFKETDKPNGMTITIAVKSSDFYKFISAAESALTHFAPYPTVLGASHNPGVIDYTIKQDLWGIRNIPKYGSEHPYVIQGFVKYPIDSSQLREYETDGVTLTDEGLAILDAPIDFYVPIGMVQVAPSREHLSYDKRTLKNMVTYINEVAEDITNNLQSLIDDCPTLWDARIAAANFMHYQSPFRKLYEKLISKKFILSYKGTQLNNGVDVSKINMSGVEINELRRVRGRYGRGKQIETNIFTEHLIGYLKSRSMFDNVYIRVDNNTRVLFNDINLSQQKIRTYIMANYADGDSLIVIKSADKKVSIAENMPAIYDVIGIPAEDVILVSTLLADGDIIENKRKISGPTDRSFKPVWCGGSKSGDCYYHGDWSREQIDLADGGYYVLTKNSKWVFDHTSNEIQSSLGLVIKTLIASGVIEKDSKVVGVNNTDYKKLSKYSNWINLQDVFEYFVQDNSSDISVEAAKETNNQLLYTDSFIRRASSNLTDKLAEGFAKKYFTEVSELMKHKLHAAKYPIFSYIEDIKFNNESIKVNLNKLVESEKQFDLKEIYTVYPMLDLLSKCNYYYDFNEEHVVIVCNYIKMIDAEREKESLMLAASKELDFVTDTV